MEKKKVKISYACPINWDAMQSVDEKNTFCDSCKMKVQDFTKESSLNTEGVHCGRFRADQVESINRTFNFNPKQVFVVSLFSLLGMAAPLAAQSTNDTTASDSITSVKKEIMKLKGVVKDKQTGEGIPFANVVIKDNLGGIVAGAGTDLEGVFSIDMLREFLENKDFSVHVSVLGFKSTSMNDLGDNDLSTSIEFHLTASEEVLGIVGIIYHEPFDRNGTKTFGSDDIQESPYRQ